MYILWIVRQTKRCIIREILQKLRMKERIIKVHQLNMSEEEDCHGKI